MARTIALIGKFSILMLFPSSAVLHAGARAASGDPLYRRAAAAQPVTELKKVTCWPPFYFLSKVGYTYMHDLIPTGYRIMHIGAIIEYRRRRLGLTQEELAERSGLSQAQVSRLESGKSKNITIESLRSIARVLGCSAADLLPEEDKQDSKRNREDLSIEALAARIRALEARFEHEETA
jgi:transcriptional regulator with XRE-family HTH domain